MVSVAALCATMPGRETYRAAAINNFCSQIFPADWQVSLLVDAHPTYSLGTKVNRLMAATTATYAIIFDDDDVCCPTRIQRQITPLLDGYDLSGTSQIYYDNEQGERYLYKGDPEQWLGAVAFTRKLWELAPWQDISQGPDTQFQNAVRGQARFYDLADPDLIVASIHSGNTCRKVTQGANWSYVCQTRP